MYVKELDIFLTMKVLENTPAVLSLGKLCDEHGYSYEWINGQKPHLIKDGIRIICNTENFVPIVVPGLTSSSSTSSSPLRTPIKQESRSSSSSSSSSPSSPTVGEMSVREREDASNSDISPVPVSKLVDDRTVEPVETQANQIPKTNKKEITIERGTCVTILRFRNGCKNSGRIWWMTKFHYRELSRQCRLQRDVRIWVNTVFILISLKTEIARSVNGPKLKGPHAEDAMAKPYLEPQIL